MERVKHFSALRTLDAQLHEARGSRRAMELKAAAEARSACWAMAAGVAVGTAAAAVAAVSARDGVKACLLLAVVACIVAALATLAMGAMRVLLRA